MGGRGGSSGMQKITISSSNIGSAGTYQAYRSGDVFDSPLGFVTFGMEKSQSYLYSAGKNASIDSYELDIRHPLVVKGDDFDDIHDKMCMEYLGKSYRLGSTLEEKRSIMKDASDAISKAGYDAVIMDATDALSGQHEYEIGVLNKSRSKVIRRK